ncbi:hypothetical protein GLOTRDRAFT_46824, partial [Gloeophyllum trabeum ATCC 11539]
TLWQIVRSCTVTVVACTWVSLHLNIPHPHESWYHGPLRQVGIVIMAIIAPELVIAWALRQWLVTLRPQPSYSPDSFAEWTKTHYFFGIMGGYMFYKDDDENTPRVLDVQDKERLQLIFKCPTFTGLTEADITDRGKRNSLEKAPAVIQGLWFILQLLARTAQNLALTELELATLGFALLNSVTYFLWWNKPHGAQRPCVLRKEQYWGRVSKTDIIQEFSRLLLSGPCRKAKKAHSKTTPSSSSCSLPREVWRKLAAGFTIVIHATLTPFLEMVKPQPMTTKAECVPTFHAGKLDLADEGITYCVTAAISMIFGAVHLAGWNFYFPSRIEQILWRSCSFAITCLPCAVWIWWATRHLLGHSKGKNENAGVIEVTFMTLLTFLYISARIALLAVAFTSLRCLSPGAYRAVSWTNYIPHV